MAGEKSAQMKEEMGRVFHENKSMFELASISEEEFVNWIMKLTDYEITRKAYKYVFGGTGGVDDKTIKRDTLYKWVLICRNTWNTQPNDPAEFWKTMFYINKTHPMVKQLREDFTGLRTVWHRRPKGKRIV